jgi:hypothetical protein
MGAKGGENYMTEIIVSHYDEELRMVVQIAQAKKTEKFIVVFETEKTGHFPDICSVSFLLDRKIPFDLCGHKVETFSASDILAANIFFSVKNFENEKKIEEEIRLLCDKGRSLFNLATTMSEGKLLQ